jgi:hypothetical protein
MNGAEGIVFLFGLLHLNGLVEGKSERAQGMSLPALRRDMVLQQLEDSREKAGLLLKSAEGLVKAFARPRSKGFENMPLQPSK